MSTPAAAALHHADALDEERARAVLALVVAATDADGQSPLSEQARLAARAGADGDAQHLLLDGPDGGLAGYAQLAGADPTSLELVVDPAARGRGLGTQLLAASVRAAAQRPATGPDPRLAAWAHGDSPAARALAARGGWRRARELWRMELDLAASPRTTAPPALPRGAVLRPFEVGRDEEAWLALNAAAFAHHPEQGRWGPADLAAREAEPWFEAAGLLLVVDERSGRLLASHWTKTEEAGAGPGGPRGEVYVVAVAPDQQGAGLGRAVLAAGLDHLAQRGVAVVDLYVDADNAPARALYERMGFVRATTDVQFTLPVERAARPSGSQLG